MISQVGIQSLFRDDLDASPEDSLEVEDESGRKPGTGGWAGIDQEIHVAVRPVLFASDGTKQSDVARAVSCGNIEDLLTFGL